MTSLVPVPLEGEILGPRDLVTVVAALHPLRSERVGFAAPAGLSVAELVGMAEQHAPSTRMLHQLVVRIEEAAIPPEFWPRVRVKAGATVTIIAVPGLGGSGALRSILMLAVAVLALAVAGPLAAALLPAGIATTIGTAVIGGLITIAGSMAINALFPVNANPNKRKPFYSISAGSNQITKDQPLPVVLGRLRVFPPYGASPHTQTSGKNQTLYLRFFIGVGAYDISDVRIGLTPITSYDDVATDTRVINPGDPLPTLYSNKDSIVEQPLQLEMKASLDWQTRTTADQVTAIEFDYLLPQGLGGVFPKSGKKHSRTIVVKVQIRQAYSGTWVDWYTISLTQDTTDPIRDTLRRNVTAGQYDVRWRKTSGDYDDDGQVREEFVITALRGFRPGLPIVFDKTFTIMDMRIRATDQLQGTIDNLNLIATLKPDKVLDGSSGTSYRQASSWPHDLFVQVLQGPQSRTPATDDEIDWPSLQGWATYNFANGFRYNKVHDERTPVPDVLRDIASAGRAIVVRPDGKWSVIWDDEDVSVVDHFTGANSWNFRASIAYDQVPLHGLRVKFINQDRDFQEDELDVLDDGYTTATATEFETVDLPGQTDHVLVHRHARFHLAQRRLRPQQYTLNVDVEHLICTRGDRVRVASDVPMLGLGQGWVKSISGLTVVLDEQVTMDAGQEYVVRFRKADGTSALWQINEVSGDTNTLQLVGTADVSHPLPAAGDLFMFGNASTAAPETVVMRVLSIAKGENLSAELTLVDDAPEISQADQGTIPAFQSKVSIPVDPTTLAPYNLALTESFGDVSIGYAPNATLVWSVPVGAATSTFEVQDLAPGDGVFRLLQIVQGPQVVLSDLQPGSHTFRVRGIYGDPARYTAWSALYAVQVVSTGLTPSDVPNFRIDIQGAQAVFQWDTPLAPVPYLDLRYTPNGSATLWEQAAPVGPRGSAPIGTMTVPLQSGTYMAKFVTAAGVYSTNPALVTVLNASVVALNVVESRSYASPFSGSGAGVVDTQGGLQLAYLLDVFGVSDVFDPPDVYLGTGGTTDEGTYHLGVIDLGEAFTSRVSATLNVVGVNLAADCFAPQDVYETVDVFGVAPSDWDAHLEIRTTMDDPAGTPTWTAWQRFTVADYTARALDFQVVLDSFAYGITPRVTSIGVVADMPDRIEKGQDILTLTTGVTHITFSPAFRATPAILAAGQAEITGDTITITNKAPTGFDVAVRNSSGTLVARTIDFMAKGYGRKAA